VGVDQERADQIFGESVVAFAELVVTDDTVRVDEIVGGPVLVVVRVPGAVVVVDGDRIVDA
jgi:hypothetical protein